MSGFTLIELLVVIAIIAILAAILIPAVTSGLEKARLMQVVSNGKSIYTSVFAADASDFEPYTFPNTGDAATSTEYFKYVVTSGVMKVDFSFFSGPGTLIQKSTNPVDFTGAGNAWNVGLGIGPGVDGAPFLISRNYDANTLPGSGDLTVNLVAVGSEVLKFSRRHLVVTQKGGASFSLKTNVLVDASSVNPTGNTIDLIQP